MKPFLERRHLAWWWRGHLADRRPTWSAWVRAWLPLRSTLGGNRWPFGSWSPVTHTGLDEAAALAALRHVERTNRGGLFLSAFQINQSIPVKVSENKFKWLGNRLECNLKKKLLERQKDREIWHLLEHSPNVPNSRTRESGAVAWSPLTSAITQGLPMFPRRLPGIFLKQLNARRSKDHFCEAHLHSGCQTLDLTYAVLSIT